MPSPEKPGRTVNKVRINRDTLLYLQGANGMNNKCLAGEAEVSEKTIERARQGIAINPDSADRIAKALGTTIKALTAGIREDFTGLKSEQLDGLYTHRFEIVLKINIPYETFKSEDRLPKYLAALRRSIHPDNPIVEKGFIDGSTILTLEMRHSDILRLLSAHLDGLLADMDIVKITIPNDFSMWLQRLRASLLIWGTTKVPPDEETWTEVQNQGMLNGL